LFWADIERHHPGLATLDLPQEAVTAWKQRLRHVTTANGTSRPRKNYLVVLGKVRSFYLDTQEWALQDASWAAWAAPSPVRRSELLGMEKARKQTVSEMHQRVRERLPHLPTLVESAERHRTQQQQLLASAKAVPVGQTFEHDGVTYLRTIQKSYAQNPSRQKASRVLVENIVTGTKTDLAATEDEAFWAWAIIETLRHSGVRAEELLEISHLALVSYHLPASGEVVPLLQIVPSKSNEERLLLVSPELASVLASIVNRLRGDNNGSIPLEPRYDPQEKTTSPPLPHLFQRKIGWRSSVISATQVHRVLNEAIARAGLFDAAGQPLRYTPHDFRRMFTTDAVTGGLPVHIAAKLLGHRRIDTVESYLAVFQDELIRTYRAFLDKRRAARPEAEYREPTEQEWQEFQQRFHARAVALGDCARPYGTPCQHEHRRPVPHAPGLAEPAAPPPRDHPQPRRPNHRGPRQRLARRSPGTRSQPHEGEGEARQPRPRPETQPAQRPGQPRPADHHQPTLTRLPRRSVA
jgi:site-specific recombinase XerD